MICKVIVFGVIILMCFGVKFVNRINSFVISEKERIKFSCLESFGDIQCEKRVEKVGENVVLLMILLRIVMVFRLICIMVKNMLGFFCIFNMCCVLILFLLVNNLSLILCDVVSEILEMEKNVFIVIRQNIMNILFNIFYLVKCQIFGREVYKFVW